MEALAKLFLITPELVLTNPPVPVAALLVDILTPTSRIKPEELLNKPIAPVPLLVRLPTVWPKPSNLPVKLPVIGDAVNERSKL